MTAALECRVAAFCPDDPCYSDISGNILLWRRRKRRTGECLRRSLRLVCGSLGSRVRSYELPCPDLWAMLGLQGSKWNDSSEVLFTINLLVVSRSVWERERAQAPYLGTKPTPNYMYGPFAWWERIGSLMPERESKWWTVNAGMDTEDLSREVLLAVESYGLPAMRAQLRN
jgi:Domain of unknown function (DUF4304)